MIDDPVLGQVRYPLALLQDVINDEGDIVVPVDPRSLGLWLTGLFGDPATTDNLDGSWDQVFAPGGDALPIHVCDTSGTQNNDFLGASWRNRACRGAR